MTPDIQSLRDKAKAAVEGLAAYRANPNINTSKTSMLATAQFKKAAGDPILILSLTEALEKAERELGEAREALKPFAWLLKTHGMSIPQDTKTTLLD